MKNINLLATTILLILCFCTNVNASDDKTPLNPDESDECKDSLFSYTQEFIHQALTDSPEKAAEKLGVPISTIHDWTDKEIGEILKGIIKEEPTQEQIPIINLSYWAVMNQTKDDAMKLQDVHTTIEMTAEKLGVSGGLLFAWISNREIQSHFMYTIAQRRKEGTLSDWVHEYKDEIDKLQSPPQHTMSLLYRDGRYNAVTLALENGIEKTAQDLDIPHSILSVLALRYTANTEIRRRGSSYPLQIVENSVREAMIMINNDNMTIAGAARDLGVDDTHVLLHWLKQPKYRQEEDMQSFPYI